jgi:hypothetical protein
MNADYQMTRNVVMGLTAALGWIGLILQFPLTIENSRVQGMTLAGGIIAYLSFFTILTNLLIAIALTASLRPKSRVGRFFTRPGVTSALAAYIATVGIVYSLLLRDLWNPEGLQKTADILLHDVVPLMFVGSWLFLFRKARLPWKGVLLWLAYPLAYLCFALVRGALTGRYPYPFIDAGKLGYAATLGNAAALLVAFAILCLVIVAIGRWTERHSPLDTLRHENL